MRSGSPRDRNVRTWDGFEPGVRVHAHLDKRSNSDWFACTPPAARPYLFEADRIVDTDRWRRSTPSGQAAIDRRERLLDVIRVVVKMRGESQDVPARRHNDPGFVETLGQDPHIRAGEPGCDDRGARAVVRGRQ